MRKLLLPLILFGLSFSAFFWYIQPTYAEIQEIQSEVSQYDATLDKVAQLQQIRDDLLSTYNSIQSRQLDRLNKMLPDAVDTVKFLIELDEVAASHGMSVQDISFNKTPNSQSGESGNSGQYNTIEAVFNVSGPYEDMLSFMRDIERSARLIDLQNVNVSTNQDGGENQYQFTLQTYWFAGQ